MDITKVKIGIIGLGYVGLPLAVAFSKKFDVVGYDSNPKRIKNLRNAIDTTNELTQKDLQSSRVSYHSEKKALKDCNFYIVTVPTPIDSDNQPDLSYLESASKDLASLICEGDTIVYESTVYPGVTEEFCVPIIEEYSKLSLNKHFYAGYSPERINPGDKTRTVDKIIKVVSGSNTATAIFIEKVYGEIITEGIFVASSIKVAEAAKVIENTQRDLNIALINELSLIFKKLDINIFDVLEAANTKWNFLDFKPGLVGGHCIGVDPYYLTYKSRLVGYNPEIILAGRKLNDSMAVNLAKNFIQALSEKSINLENAKVLILGLAFKENCPDVRNSKVFDIISYLSKHNIDVEVYDPIINDLSCEDQHFKLIQDPCLRAYDGLIFAVKHQHFEELGSSAILGYCKTTRVIYDIKNFLPRNEIDGYF